MLAPLTVAEAEADAALAPLLVVPVAGSDDDAGASQQDRSVSRVGKKPAATLPPPHADDVDDVEMVLLGEKSAAWHDDRPAMDSTRSLRVTTPPVE